MLKRGPQRKPSRRLFAMGRAEAGVALAIKQSGIARRNLLAEREVQFQIEDGQVIISAYQRSSDANLGLPCDIYHLYLMAHEIDLPLKSITLFLGNVHIYESNLLRTYELLNGAQDVKFELNV